MENRDSGRQLASSTACFGEWYLTRIYDMLLLIISCAHPISYAHSITTRTGRLDFDFDGLDWEGGLDWTTTTSTLTTSTSMDDFDFDDTFDLDDFDTDPFGWDYFDLDDYDDSTSTTSTSMTLSTTQQLRNETSKDSVGTEGICGHRGNLCVCGML